MPTGAAAASSLGGQRGVRKAWRAQPRSQGVRPGQSSAIWCCCSRNSALFDSEFFAPPENPSSCCDGVLGADFLRRYVVEACTPGPPAEIKLWPAENFRVHGHGEPVVAADQTLPGEKSGYSPTFLAAQWLGDRADADDGEPVSGRVAQRPGQRPSDRGRALGYGARKRARHPRSLAEARPRRPAGRLGSALWARHRSPGRE